MVDVSEQCPVYLTIPQAAARFDVHEDTLFRAANSGHLVALMSEREPGFARAYLIAPAEMEAWIERSRKRLAVTNPRRRRRKERPGPLCETGVE